MGMIARAFSFSRRQSPENPNTNLSRWINDWAGGEKSGSGQVVSQGTAVRLTAVYRCVRVLADGIGTLPLFLMEREGARGRKKATDHPLYNLLRLTPNPWHTSAVFRQLLQANVVLRGNGYAGIRRDAGGRIRQLWPIPANQVCAKVDDKTGELYYDVQLKDARTTERWEASSMLHVPGLGFDGLEGMSVLSAAREALGQGLALQAYGSKVFSKGGRIPGVLQTNLPDVKGDVRKNIYAGWQESVGGEENWLTPAVLPRGWEWKEVGIKPDDGQWLESRKFNVLEVCRMFGVNPHKVFDFDKATFTNFEHSSLSHVIDSLLPWCVYWEQELNRKLLTPEEQERFYFEFKLDGLLRGDTATRTALYASLRQWGALSANDIRELEDMPGIGPQGDIYLVPFNMTPADQISSPEAGSERALSMLLRRAMAHGHWEDDRRLPPAPETRVEKRASILKLRRKIRKAQQPVIEDRAASIVRKEIGAIGQELKALRSRDARSRRDLASLRSAIEEFYRTHDAYAGDRMRPILTAYAELIEGAVGQELDEGALDEASARLEQFVQGYARSFGKREAMEGRLQLLALIDEHAAAGDEAVADALQQRLDEWGEKRAGKIGGAESVRFMGATAKVLYAAAGVKFLRWVANPGACDFCRSLDGQVAGVTGAFVKEGEGVAGGEDQAPMVPSENIGHGPLHGGCECDVVAD